MARGGTDFYTQADFHKSFAAFTPFATLGYRIFGHSPLYNLKDGFYLSLGSILRTSDTTSVGLAYDWRQPIVTGGNRAHEITFFVNHWIDRQWSLSACILRGFSDASPDISVGGSLCYAF